MAENNKPSQTCPLAAKKCGGCPLLALPYPQQLAQKQAQVEKLLAGFAPVAPILPADEPWHYRNKAIATFAPGPRGKLICGIYAAGTHRVLPRVDCLLQADILNKTIAAVLVAANGCHWPAYNEDTGEGLVRHVLARCAQPAGGAVQVLVTLVTAQVLLPGSRNFVVALRKAAPWVTTVVQNINPADTSAVLGGEEKLLFGPGRIQGVLQGLQFAISSRSFYQVNPPQTEKLYAKALEFAALTGKETVLDAYCGIGTIGLCAAAHARQVVGVERNAAAARDAAANARRNKITNAQFICADATPWMAQAAEEGFAPDVVFLDPPRDGTTPACIAAVTAMHPARIVYVSCNPETLARDLTLFTAAHYRPTRLQPVDMFPHTGHCECVVLMSKVR
ncbi:MAG: 23S rRNA (uracil(1939)-C(5))-methyltransferase RlmD [Gemmiger sp.]|nr:23S rRNA (uracil(1939)-C(5))-methyltransferase RlmD [Gemmiger sp.]